MDITGDVDSVKGCVGSVFLGFCHDGYLCNCVVTRRRISKNRSKDYIIFVESCQLSRALRYVTGIPVAYFYHNNEWKLTIISRISSCDLVIYVFVGTMKINIPVSFSYSKYKR